MKITRSMTLLAGLAIAMIPGTTLLYAQGAQPAGTNAPPKPAVVLPLERHNYIIGETVPLAFSGVPDKMTISLVDERGAHWLLYSGSNQPLRWNTTLAAPGVYQVEIDGSNTATMVSLRSPLRESPMSMVDESGINPRIDIQPALKDSELTAVFWPSYLERGSKNEAVLDDYTPTATMAYINPTTRPSSFYPPRVAQNELLGFRQRLAFYAQANARYPTFGGFWYDWDGAAIFEMKGLTRWYGLGKRLDAFRVWSDRRDQAVYDDFKKRTGMDGVKPAEFSRYCLGRGRPEFGPCIDYYMFKMGREVAKSMPPIPASEMAGVEKRVDAWSHYLMNVWAEAYRGHQEFLREVMPSLRNTSSVNIDHGPVRLGHWDPGYSSELDFRYMSTWNDQLGSPDYSYQWLFTAGMLSIGRQPGQPIWLSSALAATHGMSTFPGKFQRMAGHGLAYGQTGMGLACEGFSTLFGMSEQVYPAMTNNPARWQDYIAGRDFMKRFAALGEQCRPLRKVAVLHSQVQMGRQEVTQGLATPQFAAFTTLARLGYQPQFITEDLIAAGQLQEYGGLVIMNQSESLPEAIEAKISTFTAAGGKLYLDKSSTIKLAGAISLDVALPYAQLGAPHNWTVLNSPTETSDELQERRARELMPTFYAVLGDALRTPLMSTRGAAAKASTFAMDGGRDAKYVIAVNDYSYKNRADWVQFAETLQPNGPVAGALYDLTSERSLGSVAPVSCVFTDLTARVYGVLARPMTSIDLAATQKVKSGDVLRLRVRFLDADRQPLQAAIPFALTLLQPDGKFALKLYRSTDVTGQFGLSWTAPANSPSGTWSLSIRSQLDGWTVQLPVELKAGGKLEASPITERAIVRGRDQIESLLAHKTAFVLPLFDGPALAERRAVAEQVKAVLAKRGVSVEIRDQPVMTTFTVGYDPSPEQLKENARVLSGEAFGNAVNDIEGYMAHYEEVMTGYVFGKPLILLDFAGERIEAPAPASPKQKVASAKRANPMSASLDDKGLLWPKVSSAFPGNGRATMQIVKSAFSAGVDTLVIQASDIAGLKAGAASLSDLPADWVGTGVARARSQLLEQFGIGVTGVSVVDMAGLTAKGLTQGKDAQPLAIRFGSSRPPTPEQVASEFAAMKPIEPSGLPLPGLIKTSQFKPFYLIDSNLVATILPLPGDCRFFDALACPVVVAEAGPYKVAIKGTFRFNEHPPKGQGGWETVMAAYNAIPKKRLPMTFEVFVDGQSAGQVGGLTTEEQKIELYQGGGEMVNEELVTKIEGLITFPAGRHELRLVQHNMQDGKIEVVELAKP